MSSPRTLEALPGARQPAVPQRYPAVLLAGDRSHSRAVTGRSKAFVEVAGRPMVVHVLDALLGTPEVSDVFVVGDARRLEQCFSATGVLERAAYAGRAVHIVPQRETLYENVWHGFLRTVPSGMPDLDQAILALPADIPLVVSAEISEFIQRVSAIDTDYAIGLTPDVALERFAPRDDQPGIEMACFNLREGRFRQNNLHWVRPLRMGNRHYIEDMYESRHQKELGSMIWLVLQLLVREFTKLWVLVPYLWLHLAGLLDRRGFQRSARLARSALSLRTLERASGALLRTRVAGVVTGFGGAALDVDNDADCAVADKMFAKWRALQLESVPQAKLRARG
jgi:GTP:adenosylcobinamide-phosphate guanylyltransferase